MPTLHRFAYEGDAQHVGSADFELDVELLSRWIGGASYTELAEAADQTPHPNSLFGGSDLSKRISDATQYIGKLTYPGAWVWSGAQILAGDLGGSFPSFVRGAVEHGVPSESCVELIERARVTRAAALTISALAGPAWSQAATWLLGDGNLEDVVPTLTRSDAERLLGLRTQVEVDLRPPTGPHHCAASGSRPARFDGLGVGLCGRELSTEPDPVLRRPCSQAIVASEGSLGFPRPSPRASGSSSDLARSGYQPVAKVASDLRISGSTGLTTDRPRQIVASVSPAASSEAETRHRRGRLARRPRPGGGPGTRAWSRRSHRTAPARPR